MCHVLAIRNKMDMKKKDLCAGFFSFFLSLFFKLIYKEVGFITAFSLPVCTCGYMCGCMYTCMHRDQRSALGGGVPPELIILFLVTRVPHWPRTC